MDSQSYVALAGVMKYWYLVLIGVMLISLIAVSVGEYRQRKRIRKEAGRFIGYLELIPEGTRLGLTRDNLIGSGSRADIIIESDKVAKSHALIAYKNTQLMLRPVAGETKINGRKAIREHEIFTGDMISLGGVIFKVFIKEEAAQDEA